MANNAFAWFPSPVAVWGESWPGKLTLNKRLSSKAAFAAGTSAAGESKGIAKDSSTTDSTWAWRAASRFFCWLIHFFNGGKNGATM
jgi:hypothetical protein